MNYKGIILILVVVIIFLVGAVAYLLISQPAENATVNVTNNTTPSTDNSQQIQENQSTSANISSAKAKSIAADYMDAHPDQFTNTEAGHPSLKGGIYYVPVVVTKEGQHSVGTVVAYIKVDGETGSVFGVQEIEMY